MSDTKKSSKSGQVELSENQLDDVSGGPHFQTADNLTSSVKLDNKTAFEAWPSKWKGFSLNGKGNT